MLGQLYHCLQHRTLFDEHTGLPNRTRRHSLTRYAPEVSTSIGDGQFLYLATVLDLCSKRLTGRPTADHMRISLVTDALRAAAKARGRNGPRGAMPQRQRGAILSKKFARSVTSSA